MLVGRIVGLLVLAAVAHSQTFYSTSTTNNTVVEVCHCDLTKNFCDWNCCCDVDCSNVRLR